MLKACDLLKHRLLIGLCYGCGLRCAEVRQLLVCDADTEREIVHVRQGKGNKDRCLPMGAMLARGIRSYINAEKPRLYLFEGNDGHAYSQRGAQWAVTQAVKKAGIVKEVTLHTLRHTYATHLLEQGVNILAIKDLLGHACIDTTMTYLHLARPAAGIAFSAASYTSFLFTGRSFSWRHRCVTPLYRLFFIAAFAPQYSYSTRVRRNGCSIVF